jgi:hypothetical protein
MRDAETSRPDSRSMSNLLTQLGVVRTGAIRIIEFEIRT